MKRIIKEADSDWLYMQLHMFKKGLIEPRELNDDLIGEVRDNGIVILDFNEDEYWETLGLDEDDIQTLNMVFRNYYSGYYFFDWYQAEEDFYGGAVFRDIGEENEELLEKLSRIILPQHPKDSHEFFRKLQQIFERDISDIIDDYYYEINNCIEEEIKKYAKDELCDILMEFGIYMGTCFRKYYTTVDNLLRLYDKSGDKTMNLKQLIKKISEDLTIDGRYSDYWELDYYKNFDTEGFNKKLNRNLENMIDKLEDSEMFKDIREYTEINENLSKFQFNTWYDVPKNKNQMFKISHVDPQTNYINFEYKVKKDKEIHSKALDYENFMLFLYHPELF